MKKKIIGGIAALAFAIAITMNLNIAKSNTNMSDMMLANIEALAKPEVIAIIEVGFPCYDCTNCGCIWIWSDGTWDGMFEVKPVYM